MIELDVEDLELERAAVSGRRGGRRKLARARCVVGIRNIF